MSLRQLYERRSTSEGYVPDKCQSEVISKLDDLSKSLSASQAPRGLYLYGGVGTGKTMMLDLFHESLTSKGISCDRQHFHGFLKAVDTSYHKMRMAKRGQSNLLARCAEEYVQKHRVLAFDEAHVLNIGDALLIKAFLEPYFKAGGVVVATSNVAPDDLYASGVNRETFMPFIDTLRRSCEFYQMKGREDYRLRTSQKSQLRGTYYWGDAKPSGDVTPSDFPSLMETMECHDLPKAEAMEIDVGFGRRLTCPHIWTTPSAANPATAKKIARFSFDELCRRATGPSEWLGLAENLDAILVTEVPRFEAHDEDAARRFITFIDVVYDHKRFLGITARTSPEEIFQEFISKYGGDEMPSPPSPEEDVAKPEAVLDGRIRMPSHGMASGRHGMVFQRPKSLKYTHSGGYVTDASAATQPEGPGEEWVEWSATGLKDASVFDLSPTGTSTQIRDKLLPFIRCQSRLKQLVAQIGRAHV